MLPLSLVLGTPEIPPKTPLTRIRIRNLYERVLSDLKQFNFETIGDFHSISAAMKAVVTSNTQNTIEQCRISCGGHGYSALSKFPGIYNDFGVYIPGEGENTVLLLQTAKFLIKSIEKVYRKKTFSGTASYFQK